MSGKVFLSYSRADDEPFVRRLYEGLESAGFTVWFDRVSMPSRQLTFYQEIRDAVARCERLVLIVGPGAAASEYVSQEWRFAHFEAMKCVTPIIRLGGYDLLPEDLKLLHAEDFQDDGQFEVHLANLIRQLSEALPPAGKLVGVPELPPHYLDQPGPLKDVRNLLLVDLQKPVVVEGVAGRVGLQGMGGIGKSVLASALARHPEVRRAFPDGIYWLTLGQTPDLVELQRRLARGLGDPALFTTAEDGQEKLRALWAKLATLLVLDDGWRRPHVEALSAVGPRGRLLVTSRDESLLAALTTPENCYRVKLPEKQGAIALLVKAANVSESALPAEADSVVEECGRLPLALALTGGMVRGGTPWKDVLDALHEHDLEWLADPHPAEEQHANIWRTMDASVRVLPENERERFAELAVFVAGGAPEAAVETLWQRTAKLSSREARGLLSRFVGRSLVIMNGKSRHITLHDLLRSFATGMAATRFGSECALHVKLLDAYAPHCPGGWPFGPNDHYFLEHLAYHLNSAARTEELRILLLNFAWLSRKIEATGIVTLLADFELRSLDEDVTLVGKALRLSAGILSVDANQLAGQLLGRLMASTSASIRELLHSATSSLGPNMLRPIVPSLTPPGVGLLRTIAGSEDAILAVAVTPDGTRVVAGSHFGVIRIWQLETGVLLCSVRGHETRVLAVVVTPDGKQFASAAEDGSIKLWQVETGAAVRALAGHKESATDLAVFADSSRLVSGSLDKTVIIWDLPSGAEIRRFTDNESITCLALTIACDAIITGHSRGKLAYRDLATGAVLWTAVGHRYIVRDPQGNLSEADMCAEITSLAVTTDGTRVISAGCDGAIQVWDLKNGACLNTLRGHGNLVMDVDVIPDGERAVSCSLDKIVCVWDLTSGKWNRLLRGHTEGVFSVVAAPQGRHAISGGDDKTVRVWDMESGPQLPAPPSHRGSARCLAATSNGRYVLSGSEDGTMKKWDPQTGAEVASFSGHGAAIWGLASSATGGRVVAGFNDGIWTAWNIEKGVLIGSMQAHPSTISSVAMTADGSRLIAGSYDATLSVWNLDSGEKVYELIGHWGKVMATAITPDGRWALSGSDDQGVRLWDLTIGEDVRTLSGHTDWVIALAISADGRRGISGALDGTLRMWDLKNGECLHVLQGRAGGISAVAATPDFRRAVSGSEGNWLEVWDLDACALIGAFSSDAEFRGTAISVDGTSITGGDQLGRVHFLKLPTLIPRK